MRNACSKALYGSAPLPPILHHPRSMTSVPIAPLAEFIAAHPDDPADFVALNHRLDVAREAGAQQ